MVPLYRHFVRDFESGLDFSDEMLFEMYEHESKGVGKCSPSNGYYHGKKWLNVTVAMWREDIKLGNLFLFELYEDSAYPHWWLDRIFKDSVNPEQKERAQILEPYFK